MKLFYMYIVYPKDYGVYFAAAWYQSILLKSFKVSSFTSAVTVIYCNKNEAWKKESRFR